MANTKSINIEIKISSNSPNFEEWKDKLFKLEMDNSLDNIILGIVALLKHSKKVAKEEVEHTII